MSETRRALQPRTRLGAEQRRREIALAAEQALLAQGRMPVSLEEVGRLAGVSKALVYTYFATQHDLFNTVLEARLEQLGDSKRHISGGAPEEAAVALANVYLEQVAAIGPVIHFVLRDPFMAGAIGPRARVLRERWARPIVRRLRKDLSLSASEAMVAFNLLATIPEELGVQTRRKEMSIRKARELCEALISVAIAGLKASRR